MTYLFQINCHDHSNRKENMPIVRKGETVWARHPNSRYYQGTVEAMDLQVYYMVKFDDNSFSDDLFPSDIIVSHFFFFFFFFFLIIVRNFCLFIYYYF